jgi:hypothetical protein
MSAIRRERADVSSLRGGAAPTSSEAHAAQRRLVAVREHFAQHQPFRRAGGDVAQNLSQRALQRPGDVEENEDRGVADAVFEIGQVPLGYAGRARERLAGEATTRTQSPDALAERGEKRLPPPVRGFVGPGGRVRRRIFARGARGGDFGFGRRWRQIV